MNPDLQLRDIHLPPDPGWWPPAPGWWILLLLIIVLLSLLYLQLRKRTEVRPRRVAAGPVLTLARQELARIEREHAQDPQAMLREISALLRRTAMSLHGRQRISGLTGRAWLQFLDEQSGGHVFSEQYPDLITELPYRPQHPGDNRDLPGAVRQWLQQQESRYV